MNEKKCIKKIMLVILAIILILPSLQITAIEIQTKTNYKNNNDLYEEKKTQITKTFINKLGWPLIYDRYVEDISKDIILDSNENIIVNGYTYNNMSHGYDFLTLKYTHNGEFLWDAIYDGGKYDYAWDIDVDSEDNVILFGINSSISGESMDDFNFTLYLIKYDLDGVILWNKIIKIDDDCFPGGIAVDSDDNIIMTLGKGNFDTMAFFCHTIKMDKNGNELWNTTYGQDMISMGFEVVVNDNDEIFVGGLGASFFGQGWFIAKYDSTGSFQWTKRYNTGDNLNDLEIDSEGNLILIGRHWSQDSNSTKWLTLKCDKNGNLLWLYEFDGIYHEYANDAHVDSKGNVVVLGSISSTDSYENCLLIFDPNGNELCMKKPSFDGSLLGITIDKDNIIIASGVVNDSGIPYNADSYICKFTDVIPPSVDFFTPEPGYLYMFNSKLIPFFGKTVIFGKITLSAIETDTSEVEKVIFYVDGILKETIETSPYEWVWSDISFGYYDIEIHVYDYNNNIKRKTMTIWKFL